MAGSFLSDIPKPQVNGHHDSQFPTTTESRMANTEGIPAPESIQPQPAFRLPAPGFSLRRSWTPVAGKKFTSPPTSLIFLPRVSFGTTPQNAYRLPESHLGLPYWEPDLGNWPGLLEGMGSQSEETACFPTVFNANLYFRKSLGSQRWWRTLLSPAGGSL